MPAYIRKYRVYQNSRPKKSPSRQNNAYRLGHFTTGHGVQFYLQYLLSDREQHTGCQFQRPALRVPSLKELCTPRESCLQPHTRFALPSSRLLPYQQNKKPGKDQFLQGTQDSKGGTGGQMPLSRSPSGPGWPGVCLYGAVLDSSVDTGHTHCSTGGRGARGARSRIKGAESQMCVWVWRASYELSGGRGEIQLLNWENAGTLCGVRGPLHTR